MDDRRQTPSDDKSSPCLKMAYNANQTNTYGIERQFDDHIWHKMPNVHLFIIYHLDNQIWNRIQQ
jgi:hypothetical protein